MKTDSRTRNRKRETKRTCIETSGEYMAHEKGFIIPRKEAPIRIALVFPNRYEVGMANLGFQTVFRLWNQHPEVSCERAFFPKADASAGVSTLETCRRLNLFDIVGFSLSFELDLVHILQCMMETGIPLLRSNRTDHDPLILAGGAVTGLNPSPLLPFFDGLLVGDGEGILERMAERFVEMKSRRKRRDARLDQLAELEGCFIPGRSERVKRQVFRSLESIPTYTSIVTAFSHFGNMFVVEVGRGCTRGCLFCAAQKIYSPYRFRSPEMIIETVARYNPGAHRIGLEGAGISDYPELEELSESLVNTGYKISLSSVRSDRITNDLIGILERGDVRSISMAPEAGTERLRRCIGKEIEDETLSACADLLGRSTIDTLKLYYLIGLPGETESDVQSLIEAVRDLSSRFIAGRKHKHVRLSVNSFIPKAHTEFQWESMNTEREIVRKRRMIYRAMHREKQITCIPKSSRDEVLQGLLSKGDDRVGLALMDAQTTPLTFKQALANRSVDPERVIHRTGMLGETLPWDFIDSRISKKRLWDRYRIHMGWNPEGRA